MHVLVTCTSVISVMPSSHRRHGQTKIVLSCLCRWCELNWWQVKTVFSRPPLSGFNCYELLATCSKYNIDASHMSENIVQQTLWNASSYTVDILIWWSVCFILCVFIVLLPLWRNKRWWCLTIANWKLGSRRDKTVLTCRQFSSTADTDKTRQDKTVVSCPCRRCEIIITFSHIAYSLDIIEMWDIVTRYTLHIITRFVHVNKSTIRTLCCIVVTVR